MPRRKCVAVFLLCACFLFVTAVGSAAEPTTPRRIAIVPTAARANLHYPDMKAYCDDALHQSLRVPLNSILNVNKYITPKEIAAALPELRQPDKAHSLTPDRLKAAAKELDADLIVGFVITDFRESRFYNWDGEMILDTYVALSLIGYDRQKDAFIELRRRESFRDEESIAGSLLNLTKQAADVLLQKADFKKDIFPLSEKYKLN